MVTALNEGNIKKEILNTLRNADIFTTTQRSVTTVTDNFTATAGQTVFNLTYEPRNIRAVTVASVSKYYFLDYEFDAVAKTLTLYSGASLNNAVAIQYDYGTTGGGGDKIYPDFPREDLSLNSYPRIGFQIISIATQPLGLGATHYMSDLVVSFKVTVPADKISTIGGVEYLETTKKALRQALLNNQTSFKLFKYIKPTFTSPNIPGQNNKIISKIEDYMIRFLVE